MLCSLDQGSNEHNMYHVEYNHVPTIAFECVPKFKYILQLLKSIEDVILFFIKRNNLNLTYAVFYYELKLSKIMEDLLSV